MAVIIYNRTQIVVYIQLITCLYLHKLYTVGVMSRRLGTFVVERPNIVLHNITRRDVPPC
jgi:hypothetical protein